MQKYKVTALNVAGLGNRAYFLGDTITAAQLGGEVKAGLLEKGGYVVKDGEIFIEARPRVYVNNSKPQNITANHKAIVLDLAPTVFAPIAAGLKEEVEADEKYNGCVFVCGYVVTDFFSIKRQYPNSKIVVYQLEQLCDAGTMWNTPSTWQWLNEADEILEYSIENLEYLKRSGIDDRKITYRPIRFSKEFLVEDYDALFYGYINQRRADLLKLASESFDLCIIGTARAGVNVDGLTITPPKFNADLWGYIKRSKVVLNIHFYKIQEQVRVAELLANGVTVLSESSPTNYYEGLLTEFTDGADMVKKLKAMVAKKPAYKVADFVNHTYPKPREFNPDGLNVLTLDTTSKRFEDFESKTGKNLSTPYGVYIGIDDRTPERWRGCGVGVKNLLNRAFETQDYTIFCEDDADFTEADLQTLISSVEELNRAGIAWDIIVGTQAGFYGKVVEQPIGGRPIYKVTHFSSCVLNAYNKSVMREFDNYDEKAGTVYTNTYDKFLALAATEGRLRVYALSPFISRCLPAKSTMWADGESDDGYDKHFKASQQRLDAAIIDYNKLQIYTSFTDGYDAPREDVRFIPADAGKYENPAKDAGVVKYLYWKYGVRSAFNMWVDGSIYPTGTTEDYLELLGDNDLCLFQHPWRDCIYDEIEETLKLGFDLPEVALPMLERFKAEGYPANNGLGETGVLIRRDSPLVRKFFAEVWREIEKGSHRDQLCFNYVLKKFPKLRVKYMPPSVRNHPKYVMINHKKHVHKVDGKLTDVGL